MVDIASKNKAFVSLNAIKNNALKIRRLIGKNVKLCAVVKADAYGHGATMVSNALYSVCDSFAVALSDEGIALRQAGIDKDILLLTPVTSDTERAVMYNLTLSVCRIEDISLIEKACKNLFLPCKVHIKFNSGMNRLGCDLLLVDKIISRIKQSDFIELDGIYSHFYMPENKQISEKQYNNFIKAVQIAKNYKKDITAHISASGGILADKKYQLDMVRAGIMLYGYKPYKSDKISLEKALKIKAEIIADHSLSKGENLLYGDYMLECDKDVSIVRLGYADGFLRNGIENNLNNLCMDLSAVENKGDNFIVYDDFEKIAKEYNTISYEVLCNVTKRSEFIYDNG